MDTKSIIKRNGLDSLQKTIQVLRYNPYTMTVNGVVQRHGDSSAISTYRMRKSQR